METFRVVTVDLPGFGKSDRPDMDFSEFDKTMNFFVGPIIHVVKFLNLKNICVIGHSYSGLISTYLAPYIKDRIIGVWLASPAGFTSKVYLDHEKDEMYEKFGKKYSVGSDMMRFLAYMAFDKVDHII